MGYRYSSEVRSTILALSVAGRSAKDLAAEFGVGESTIYLWRSQDRVDRGETAGVTSTQADEIKSLEARVAELEKG